MTRGAVGRFWRGAPATPWRSRGTGALVLAIGLVVLAVPPEPLRHPPTWEALLAPYSTGAPLPDDFRIQEIRRGSGNEVVISVRGPDDRARVEVLVVERDRWKSAHESRSFTIDYEVPRSPAAEREAMTALLAATIRSRDHGLPAPDAVPLRAGDPGVLPWWLATLWGARGTLLGASLALLGLIAVHPSPILARAGVALGVTDLATGVAGVPLVRADIGAVWTMPASVVLLFFGLRSRRSGTGTSLSTVLVITVVALVLRLALGPWGPLHVNGQGARFVAGAAGNPADIAAYGPGYSELFAPIAALAPSNPDWAIFACNALLSALLIPLALMIGGMTGVAARAAFVAALLLAIDPVAIRMGATEAYFPAIAFLCSGASAVLLLTLRESAAGGAGRAAALVVAAGLVLSQAARIHPSAWVLMATVPFVILAGDAGSWWQRVLMFLAAAAVGGGVLLVTSASVLLDVLGNIRAEAVLRPRPPSLSPIVWVGLAAAAYAGFAPRRWLALPAGISVAAMLLTRQAFGASWIWEQSYFRLYLTIPLIAAIGCVPPAVLRQRRVALVAAAVLALAWVRFAWPIVTARTAEHLEYRWLREQLQRLPPECRVIHLASAGMRVLALPTYLGRSRPAVAMDLRQPLTIEAALSPTGCLYYVHSSLCSTTDGRPACEEIEGRLALVPVARASFIARQEIETFSHDADTVETVIARVERLDGPDSR